ncbi:MAG: hypothetical protein HDS93_00660 [Bacteroidales bacterium]|nr:hypothetical protein [Bacteroidales bacterium]
MPKTTYNILLCLVLLTSFFRPNSTNVSTIIQKTYTFLCAVLGIIAKIAMCETIVSLTLRY